MAIKIDGTAFAKKHEEVLKEKIKLLDRKPHLISFLIGDDQASLKYSKLKQKKAEELGINFEIFTPPNFEFTDLAKELIRLNGLEKDYLTGLMIQLPLPEAFLDGRDPNQLIRLIDKEKDVDGMREDSPYLAATVRGILSILDDVIASETKQSHERDRHVAYTPRDDDALFAVIGSEGFVGKKMVKALKDRGLEVIEVDEKNPLTKMDDLKNADIIISCVGKNNLITGEMIKDGAILIDVGLGDFSKSALEKSFMYTPKIGGVGPMTVISLMENIIEASLN